jgi:hypothetical protein
MEIEYEEITPTIQRYQPGDQELDIYMKLSSANKNHAIDISLKLAGSLRMTALALKNYMESSSCSSLKQLKVSRPQQQLNSSRAANGAAS